MAKTIKFYIKDKAEIDHLCDFYQESDLAPRITKAAFDIENFDSRRGDYTLNLSLPKTNNNQVLFDFVGDIQNRSGFFQYIQYKARIEVDNNIIIEGLFIITSVDNESIFGDLVGNNISWTELISDKSIRDINLRSVKYSGLRGITNNITTPFVQGWNVQESNLVSLYEIWDSNESDGLYDFCMPFLGFGNFYSPNTRQNPLSTISTITESSGLDIGSVIDNNNITANEHNTLSEFHFKPACYIKSMMRQIFTDIGYEVTGNFFSDAQFNNLIIPASGDNLDNSWNWNLMSRWILEQVPITLGAPASFQFTGGSPGGGFDTTGRYSPYFNDFTNANGVAVWLPGFAVYDKKLSNGAYPSQIKLDYAYNEYSRLSRDYVTVPEFTLPAQAPMPIPLTLDDIDGPYFIAPVDGTYRLTINNRIGYSADRLGGSLNPFATRFVAYIQKFENNSQITPQDMYDGSQYIINNLPVNDPSVVVSQTFTVVDPAVNTNFTILLDTQEIKLKKGDKLIYAIATYRFFRSNFILISSPFCQWRVELITNADENLHPNLFLPDINQIDFMKSILNLFNLYIFVEDKTVVINTKKNYFLPPSAALDWDEKCDIKEAIIRPIDFAKLINFIWLQEDGETLYPSFYYDHKRRSDSRFYVGEKTIDNIFAATGIRNYTFIQPISNIDPTYFSFFSVNIPTLSNNDEINTKIGDSHINNYDKLPRVLKYKGLQIFTTSGYLAIEDLSFNRRGSYFPNVLLNSELVLPMAEFESTTNFSLSWRNLPDDTNPQQRGLFSLFYKADLEFIEKSSIMELPVKLNSVDIEQLDVRRPVVINNQLFIINEVKDFNPIEDSTTKVILYRK